MRLVRRMRHFTDVQLRQQYENKSLNQCHEHAQRHQQNRRGPCPRWSESGDGFHHLLVGEQVAEKTNAERKRTNQVTDQLDREDQPTDPPDRTSQMFQVTKESVSLIPIVVVKER